jgi:aryl-alcohol dehydrogenase-like predicted oxidoreductase
VTQDWGGLRNQRNLAIAAETAAVAEEVGATPSQVAIAWLRARPEVVIPILGATKHSQLADNLGALDVRLSPEQRARLETASAIELGFPEAFLERGREFAYAGTDALIDDHRSS